MDSPRSSSNAVAGEAECETHSRSAIWPARLTVSCYLNHDGLVSHPGTRSALECTYLHNQRDITPIRGWHAYDTRLAKPMKYKRKGPHEAGLFLELVEVGGIEPPSEGTPSPALHA